MTVNDQQREIILMVVTRFLNLRQSTQRRLLLRKFKNVDELNALVSRGFFSPCADEAYLPAPIAFHHCGNAEYTVRAKHALERTLYTLQSLDEAYPEKEKAGFSREDFLTHAARIYDPKPDEADLFLGLYLSTQFGIFTHWSGDTANFNVPTSFGFNEGIVTIDPSQMWDEHVKSRDQPVKDALRFPAAKASLPVETLHLPGTRSKPQGTTK